MLIRLRLGRLIGGLVKLHLSSYGCFDAAVSRDFFNGLGPI